MVTTRPRPASRATPWPASGGSTAAGAVRRPQPRAAGVERQRHECGSPNGTGSPNSATASSPRTSHNRRPSCGSRGAQPTPVVGHEEFDPSADRPAPGTTRFARPRRCQTQLAGAGVDRADTCRSWPRPQAVGRRRRTPPATTCRTGPGHRSTSSPRSWGRDPTTRRCRPRRPPPPPAGRAGSAVDAVGKSAVHRTAPRGAVEAQGASVGSGDNDDVAGDDRPVGAVVVGAVVRGVATSTPPRRGRGAAPRSRVGRDEHEVAVEARRVGQCARRPRWSSRHRRYW